MNCTSSGTERENSPTTVGLPSSLGGLLAGLCESLRGDKREGEGGEEGHGG